MLDDVGHCGNVKNNFLNKPNYFPDARLNNLTAEQPQQSLNSMSKPQKHFET